VGAQKQNHHLTSQKKKTHTQKFAFVQLTHVKRTKNRALRIFSCDKMTRVPLKYQNHSSRRKGTKIHISRLVGEIEKEIL
jgi:hypothetical protein